MARAHWVKWWTKDWLSSKTRLLMTAEQRGVYLDALFLQHQEGSLPDDPVGLQRLLGITAEEFERCWPTVRKHFEADDDGQLFNHRMRDELATQTKYSREQSERAKQRHKRTQMPPHKRTQMRADMQADGQAEAEAEAEQTACRQASQFPNWISKLQSFNVRESTITDLISASWVNGYTDDELTAATTWKRHQESDRLLLQTIPEQLARQKESAPNASDARDAEVLRLMKGDRQDERNR